MGWLEAKDGIVPSRVQGWTVIWPGKDGDFVSSKGFGKDCDFEIVPRVWGKDRDFVIFARVRGRTVIS